MTGGTHRALTLGFVSIDLVYRVGVKIVDRVTRHEPGALAALDGAYCARVWRRHADVVGTPRRLVELGPGASLGVGLEALGAGVESYVALDSVRRSSLPVPPELASRIEYRAPWTRDAIAPGSVDAVISQAVMEHVADIEGTYAAIAAWLVPGGRMSHQVDFRSHAVSPWWNGHLRYPDDLWARLRPRSDPINRRVLSEHLRAIERAGLQLVRLEVDRRPNRIPRSQRAPRFRDLDEDDLTAASAFLVAQRPG